MENDARGSFVNYIVTEYAGGSILPKPCRKCGRARQSEPQLCTSCGATVAKINKTRTEKKAHKFYKLVLAELVKSTTQQ